LESFWSQKTADEEKNRLAVKNLTDELTKAPLEVGLAKKTLSKRTKEPISQSDQRIPVDAQQVSASILCEKKH